MKLRQEDGGVRLWILAAYWAAVLLLGLPLWWWTTRVPRASVSVSLVQSLQEQFRQDRQLLPLRRRVHVWFLGGVERRERLEILIEKYHLSTRIRTDTRETVEILCEPLDLPALTTDKPLAELAASLPPGPAAGWHLYLLPLDLLPRLVRQGNPTLLHLHHDRRLLMATDEDLAEVNVTPLLQPILHRLYGLDPLDEDEVPGHQVNTGTSSYRSLPRLRWSQRTS